MLVSYISVPVEHKDGSITYKRVPIDDIVFVSKRHSAHPNKTWMDFFKSLRISK